MRLVFVADLIPPELERIVEFLNRNMRSVDVIALEVKQFVGGAQTNLVARLLGQSAATRQAKSVARGRQQWDEMLFFAGLAETCESVDVETMREVFDWSRSHFTRIKWGGGGTQGSASATLDIAGESYSVYALQTTGTIQFWFTFFARHAPFDEPELRDEFRRRLKDIEGAAIDRASLEGMPSISIRLLRDPDNRRRFYDAINWFIQTARVGVP